LTKKYKIWLAILIFAYPVYKTLRELVWVTHASHTVDNSLQIKVRVDRDIFGFLDYNYEKTITLINNTTNKKTKISYISLEPSLYFFLDSANSKRIISIIDMFAGQNSYDNSSLNLLGDRDCFVIFGGCGGFSDSALIKLGKPDLIFDYDGLHK